MFDASLRVEGSNQYSNLLSALNKVIPLVRDIVRIAVQGNEEKESIVCSLLKNVEIPKLNPTEVTLF